MIALLCHFLETMVEIGKDGWEGIIGCGEEHGVHLEFEDARLIHRVSLCEI